MPTVSFSTAFVRDVVDRLTPTNTSGERQDVLSVAPFVYGIVPSSTVTQANAHRITSNSSIGGILADIGPASIVYDGGLFFNNENGRVASSATTPFGIPATILFRNSSGTTLTTYTANELTRTIDAEGYCVLSNFPPKTPSTAGTISDILFRADAESIRTITLTVGAPDSGADVQFDDRTLVTNQPWRLDGSIKFRIPISYEYST